MLREWTPPLERWATFDCYGTLVDWESGIRAELERLFGEVETVRGCLPAITTSSRASRSADPSSSYRDVMASVLARLAGQEESRAW